MSTWRSTTASRRRSQAERWRRQGCFGLPLPARWPRFPDVCSGVVSRPEKRPCESWAELAALAAELGSYYGPMVMFAAATGLRPGEWIALEQRDIDREARVVYVRRAYRHYGHLARDGRDHAINLLDTFSDSAAVNVHAVDAAWTSEASTAVHLDNGKTT
jgi:integrase